jgi:hypothetical protein
MTKVYDYVLSSPFSNYDFFAHRLRELCGQMGLSFFFVDDVWVHEFLAKLEAKEISVRFLLDLTANQVLANDPYTRLARLAKTQGAYVVDDPDVVVHAAHKARFHQTLLEHKVPVPETIVVSREDVKSFKITDEMKRRVGVPFVVKPAWGDSGVGVNVDGQSDEDLRRSLAECPNSDSFLIQQRVTMKDLGNHKGWFRMYYICGTVIACWWDPVSHEYHLVRPSQVKEYKLNPLRLIMRKIAKVSTMSKFSAELCLTLDNKFYAVDYVNADPDMNPRSFYVNGVPDEIVRYIAWLLFNKGLAEVKRGRGFFDQELTESDADANWLEQRKVEQAEHASDK